VQSTVHAFSADNALPARQPGWKHIHYQTGAGYKHAVQTHHCIQALRDQLSRHARLAMVFKHQLHDLAATQLHQLRPTGGWQRRHPCHHHDSNTKPSHLIPRVVGQQHQKLKLCRTPNLVSLQLDTLDVLQHIVKPCCLLLLLSV
jgi:hypothetical protein